jgi:polar amino acid transport system substrate-binding protein
MKTPHSSRRARFAFALPLLMAVLCTSTATAQDADTDGLRICTFPAAGFFARDASGAASGFEYDLLTGFATTSRFKATFEDVPQFDQLLKDTAGGRCQIGSATVTVTDERKARLAFSTPYFPNRVVVVQKTSSAFAQPADLKDRRVAVVKGTVSIGLVGNISGAKPVLADDDDAAFQALLKGTADAVACDSAIVLHYLKLHEDLAIAFPMGERSFFAFALPQGSKFLGPLNDYIKSLQKSGGFTKLLAKHFGDANAELLADDVAKAAARP